MSNRNDKTGYRPNYYNQQFSVNPNLPYVANSGQPFHPIPFQNQFYPSQDENYGNVGTQTNLSAAENAMIGLSLLGAAALLQNNYIPNIPGSENQYGPSAEGCQPKETGSYSKSSCDSEPHKYLGNQPSYYKSNTRELQASAQVFVPQDRNKLEMNDISAERNSVHQNSQNSSGAVSIANNSANLSSLAGGYNDGARPKEVNNSKATNKKHSSNSRYAPQNWQSKENRSYNEGRSTSFNNKYKSSSGGYPLSARDGNRFSSYNGNNMDYQKFNMMNPHQGGYDYDFGYNNGYNTSANGYNRGNQNYNNQRRQEPYNLRKNEWRRPFDKNNDYSYESGGKNRDYYNRVEQNYYPKNLKQSQYNTYSNGDVAGNRKVNDGQNKKYGNKWQRNYSPEVNSFNLGSNNNVKQQVAGNKKSNFQENLKSRPESTVVDARSDDENADSTIPPAVTEDNEKMQRENLIENLSKGVYECMVCCERIRQQHAIWSCSKCFNCFHLGCIKKWAGTSQGEPGWRCPACQNQNSKIPGYVCFCKKMREPEWNRKEIPHSCGEVCGKKRENLWCTHKCTILCHPGPCPDCSAFIKRKCQCEKTTKEVRCSQTEPFVCSKKCSRVLNCLAHDCEKLCHIGACEPCKIVIEEECFCKKEKREVLCTQETSDRKQFSCESVCEKTLSCGNHNCTEKCHSGPCSICQSSLEIITTCPCGKMNLGLYYEENKIEGRKSCVDPIPTCGAVCGKVLKCGTPGNFHTCEAKCHEGPCPECQSQTDVRCRCGYMDTKIPCTELLSKADEVVCKKQCKKIRQCGRHKCGIKCCIDVDHVCSLVCGKFLSCRVHKCQEPCHRGNCPRCWETSFEELSCHCGSSVMYPPIPCGTEPPACELPCRRQQPCTHAVAHTCHADPKCPPCTTLSSKPCFGGHTTMKSTPCYVNAMSCGGMCGKKLPCGKHVCQKVCHDGSCTKGNKCTQKCSEIRPSCKHLCNNTCHKGACPNTPCKEMVTVSCICGNRKVDMSCSENEKEYKSMTTTKLTSELHSLNSGESIDISQIFSGSTNPEKLKRLECNGDCALLARNRQLALALQITNPEARESLVGGDGYSNLFTDTMKDEARKDMNFAMMVHTALTDLVMKAKQSKHKSRSHSFAPMNRDKRRFIHEYAKVFACQSMAYDDEPKKNVVVTACRLMSRLPPISVVSLIKKEQGQRKIPGPVLNRKSLRSEENGKNGTQMKRLEKSSSFEKKEKETAKEQPSVIDYFDFS